MLWYRFRQVELPAFEGRILRLFETGNLEERRVISDLRSAGVEILSKDPSTGGQWEIVDCKGHMKGHADGAAHGVLESPATWHLFECKSMSEKYYNAMVKHGCEKSKPVYWAQCQLYMGGLGLKRALFVCVNKNTDAIYIERIKYSAKEYKALIEKANGIIFSDTPPARISDKPDYFKCRYCDMSEICHGKKWPRVNCRTCAHSTPVDGGLWHCKIKDACVGSAMPCTSHVFLPTIVAHWAEPIDGDTDWVKYRAGDYEFVNCAAGAFPGEAVDHYSSEDLRNG